MSECPSGFLGQLSAGIPASCSAHLAPSGPVTKPSGRLYREAPTVHTEDTPSPGQRPVQEQVVEFPGAPTSKGLWVQMPGWYLGMADSWWAKQRHICPWLSFAPLPPWGPLSRVWPCPHWLQTPSLEGSLSPEPRLPTEHSPCPGQPSHCPGLILSWSVF